MSLLQEIKNSFDEREIKYFQGNAQNENIINVPYRGIKNEKNIINIYMEIYDDLNLIKFSFSEELNDNVNITHAQSELLNLNASLNFGKLAMRLNSHTIEYEIKYLINQDSFSFEEYTIYIIRCINVYEELRENGLI